MLHRLALIPLLLLFVQGCTEVTVPVVPAALEKVAADPEVLRVGETVEVAVKMVDEGGVGLEGLTVRWTTAAGSGSASSDSVVTGVEGVATFQWTLGTRPGEQRITASAADLPPADFVVDVLVGETSFLELSHDSIRFFASGEAQQVTVIARDKYDNPVYDAELTWTSGDPAVAKVEPYGVIRSTGRGVTVVRASAGTARDSVSIYALPRGVFTITFDDGFSSAHTVAFPLLQEAGLKANVAVNPTPIDMRWTGYLTEGQLTELHDAGWSIVSHTMSHSDLTKVSDSQLQYELAASRAWIEARGYRGANVFVTPFHSWGEREKAAVRQHYAYARGNSATEFTPERYQPWPIVEPFGITGLEPEVFEPSFTTIAGRELLRRKLVAALDRGDVVDVFFHNIAASQVDGFAETVKVLEEFRADFKPYHELTAQ